jgi:hypothetical protein
LNVSKASRRDRKINRRKNGMVVDGAGLKDIERIQKERAQRIIEKSHREQERKDNADL